jgi:hypothetical protein
LTARFLGWDLKHDRILRLQELRAGGQKPGFFREDALQNAETAKNPVSLVLMRNKISL